MIFGKIFLMILNLISHTTNRNYESDYEKYRKLEITYVGSKKIRFCPGI